MMVTPLGKPHFLNILIIKDLSLILSSTPTFAPTAHCIPFHRKALPKPSESAMHYSQVLTLVICKDNVIYH